MSAEEPTTTAPAPEVGDKRKAEDAVVDDTADEKKK